MWLSKICLICAFLVVNTQGNGDDDVFTADITQNGRQFTSKLTESDRQYDNETIVTEGQFANETAIERQFTNETIESEGQFTSELPESTGKFNSEITESEGQFTSELPESTGKFNSEITESEGLIAHETTESEGEINSETTESEGEFTTETTESEGEINSETTESEGEFNSETTDSNGLFDSGTTESEGLFDNETTEIEEQFNSEGTEIEGQFNSETTDSEGQFNSETADNEGQFTSTTDIEGHEKRPSDIILALLEHFKQSNPVGLPTELVPDPSPMDDSQQFISLGVTMYFTNTHLYGMSKLYNLYVNADIKELEVQGSMSVDELESRGDYNLATWFDSVRGICTIHATKVNATGVISLGVQLDGLMQVQDVNIDLALSTINTDFTNAGLLGGVFQSFINSGGTTMFDSMKPDLLEDAYKKIRTDIDSKLERFLDGMQFPNSIPALDMVIINARDKIRDMHLDPYHVNDFNQTYDLVTIRLFDTWVTGLSSILRVGNVTVKLENNTAVAEFEVGTKKLEGRTQWDISAIGGFIAQNGTTSFSVDYVTIKIIVEQPLDTRKKPIFKDMDLDVGNIQARCDGSGALDYFVEAAVNILPNLLRYQIIGAIEGPLKERVQKELNELNVEELIKNELPRIDAMQDMKLSDLMRTNMEDKIYDEDEFFNF